MSPAHLKPVGTRHILVRMLRNLKAIYYGRVGFDPRAVCARSHPLLDPRSLEELMERGACTSGSNASRPALDDFQSFLSQAPEHTAAETAREAVLRLLRQVDRDQLSRNPGLSDPEA